MTVELWGAHVTGPDEYHAFPTREAAEDWAMQMNAALIAKQRQNPSEFWPLCWASPVRWPWDAKSHAEDLAKHGGRGRMQARGGA